MNSNIENIEQILNQFEEEHKDDIHYTRDIRSKLYKWINNTEDIELKNIMLELFLNFKIFSRLEVREILLELLEATLNEVDITKTKICHLPSKTGKLNGSYELTALIREIDREEDNNYLEAETIVSDLKYIKETTSNIILFDDIAGTGKTVIDFIKINRELLKDKHIYINFIAITKVAKEALIKFKYENSDLDINIRYLYEKEKAFDTLERLSSEHRDKFYLFEQSLVGKDFILGYKDSQLLIGFYTNIPNNSISSFWIDDDWVKHSRWNPLFVRYKPGSKKDRKLNNMRATVNSGRINGL